MTWLYELFILNPNMASFLAGIEDLCDVPYSSISLYSLFGITMLASTIFIYLLKYHIIFDLARFSYIRHWWIFAITAFCFNFGFAFLYLWNLLENAGLKFECDEEFINIIFKTPDVAEFAFVNGMLSFIVFILLSCPPLFRKLSRNCFALTPFSNR